MAALPAAVSINSAGFNILGSQFISRKVPARVVSTQTAEEAVGGLTISQQPVVLLRMCYAQKLSYNLHTFRRIGGEMLPSNHGHPSASSDRGYIVYLSSIARCFSNLRQICTCFPVRSAAHRPRDRRTLYCVTLPISLPTCARDAWSSRGPGAALFSSVRAGWTRWFADSTGGGMAYTTLAICSCEQECTAITGGFMQW